MLKEEFRLLEAWGNDIIIMTDNNRVSSGPSKDG